MEGKDLLQDGDLLADGYSDCIVGVAVVVACNVGRKEYRSL
jgi:hypothetical protein